MIDLAVAMTRTPAEITDELRVRLRGHFSEVQVVELAAGLAWENYRARFNRVFDLQAPGYSAGAFCALPEHA